jgi:hypothetical protein
MRGVSIFLLREKTLPLIEYPVKFAGHHSVVPLPDLVQKEGTDPRKEFLTLKESMEKL